MQWDTGLGHGLDTEIGEVDRGDPCPGGDRRGEEREPERTCSRTDTGQGPAPDETALGEEAGAGMGDGQDALGREWADTVADPGDGESTGHVWAGHVWADVRHRVHRSEQVFATIPGSAGCVTQICHADVPRRCATVRLCGQTGVVSDDSGRPTPRILTLMGSGETAPTMVGTHRRLAGRLATGPATVRSMVRAVVLDTPYGFQENANELADRAVQYFSESIDVDLAVAGLTRLDHDDPLRTEHGLDRLRDADYVFAGPGSPTYALAQWHGGPVPGLLAAKLERGGIVVFASAAALTLGAATVPVYEIYKCGHAPHWLDGLDLLGTLGIRAAVIPHYDNAEGGHHDTRFCYLGEQRLVAMERMLPTDTWVLGIDEHTGLVLDLDAGTAEVVGNSTVTIRVDGHSRVHHAGTTFGIEELIDPTTTARVGSTGITAPSTPSDDGAPESTTGGVGAASLMATAADLSRAFDTALGSGDADGATRCVLELEEAVRAWSADTLQGDESDRARELLRSMITRLGAAARRGVVDPRQSLAPFVGALLEVRSVARAEKRYDISDIVRDRLSDAGIEVRDTPDGAEWDIA